MTADMAPKARIEANLEWVRERMRIACARAGREPDGVTLIGVTKGVGLESARAAIQAGLADVGENYVQEAVAKKAGLGDAGARWHLIGHLQTNKVGLAIEAFDIIHAVDSVRLAQTLNERASRAVPVLVEVNVAGEASKFGFPPSGVSEAVRDIGRLSKVRLIGLMTVAPAVDDPREVRPIFARLRDLAVANGLRELSMGMTDDFEVAIEEGATMVRIGRALFGERAP